MKWYYIDKDGKHKKYFGNVVERDGKFFGTLTKTIKSTKRANVFEVPEKEAIDEVKEYFTWKDNLGNVHNYDESVDGKILYDKDGKPYINKLLETKIELTWHEG